MKNFFKGITTQTNALGQELYSAKEAYTQLELPARQYSKWYKKDVLDSNYLRENIDYVIVKRTKMGGPYNDFMMTEEALDYALTKIKAGRCPELRVYMYEKSKKLKNELRMLQMEVELLKAKLNQ